MLFLRHRTALYLAATILLALPLSAMADENPLQAHRDRASRKAFETVQAKAIVTQTMGGDQLLITLPPGQAKNISFDNGDHLRLAIAGKILEARFVSRADYQQLMDNQALRETLDVDVLCLPSDPERPGTWVIIGLGGGLVDWLHAKPGMAITLEKVIK